MKIAVTSDLHGYLPKIEPCEILLICGDICPTENHNSSFQELWLINKFIPWVASCEVEKVMFIAGNHDFYFAKRNFNDINPIKDKLVYMQNTLVYYKSYFNNERIYKIFGTPYCKQFSNWAFMESPEMLHEYYSIIPEDLDIFISHDAPQIEGLGMILEEGNWQYGNNAGNYSLGQFVLDRKPKYAFCGHIHSGDHNLINVDGIKLANVSLVNEEYEPVNPVLYLDI